MTVTIRVSIESVDDGYGDVPGSACISGAATASLIPIAGDRVVRRDEISIKLLDVGERALKGFARERAQLRARHGKDL